MGINRRQWLSHAACGFGAVALQTMLHRDFGLSEAHGAHLPSPHFEPRVRSVIFLYMDGGPSQIDTFDPKPLLAKYDGKPFPTKMEPTQFNNVGNTLASPWKFQKYGESGIEVSELFPHVAKHVDSLAVIRSMVSEFSEHTNANYFLHTGSGLQGRPSMGAWTTYGLGSENENLPGYVVLNGGLIPPGGLDNFNSGFLPAAYQGSILGASDPPLANIRSLDKSPEAQVSKFQLMRQLDQANLAKHGSDDQIESAISNYELAFRMQTAIPELMEVRDETPATLAAYGLNHDFANTKTFGRQCLIARRLVERGVRFIELTCPDSQKDRWDQHSDLKEGHTRNALAVDQPIAALLADLKQRGLLDSTLVVWGGEFGRTPFAQGANGRDHNPFGFSIWMAGGGVRGGQVYGSTDDFGYKAIENKVEIHDLHATMLHLLGVHHERLTFRFGGRDMRLTDVHGHILHDILA